MRRKEETLSSTAPVATGSGVHCIPRVFVHDTRVVARRTSVDTSSRCKASPDSPQRSHGRQPLIRGFTGGFKEIRGKKEKNKTREGAKGHFIFLFFIFTAAS